MKDNEVKKYRMIDEFVEVVHKLSVGTLKDLYLKSDLGLETYEEYVYRGESYLKTRYIVYILEDFKFISLDDFQDLIDYLKTLNDKYLNEVIERNN